MNMACGSVWVGLGRHGPRGQDAYQRLPGQRPPGMRRSPDKTRLCRRGTCVATGSGIAQVGALCAQQWHACAETPDPPGPAKWGAGWPTKACKQRMFKLFGSMQSLPRNYMQPSAQTSSPATSGR